MRIIEVTEFSNEYMEVVRKFISVLTTEPHQFTEEYFREILDSGNSHLFLLEDDNQIAGMLTVGIYRSPTCVKAWIEDVVVDEAYRGKGLGSLLTQHAINFAKSQHVDLLMLTSNPSRTAANKLYQSIGFKQKLTNVYMFPKEDES